MDESYIEEEWEKYRRAFEEMEPMSVSPPTQYLPGFLLGGESPEETMSRSPSALHRSAPQRPQLFASPGPQHLAPDYNRGSKSKTEGPPIAGLFDDITNRTTPRILNSPDVSRIDISNRENSQSEVKGGFWVVVYGFPPSHAKEILSVFTQVGQVLEHCFPNSGNWMFLKFHSRMEVRKALAYNEKILCGNVMIGVSERRSGAQAADSIHDRSLNQSISSPGYGSRPVSPQLTPRIRHLGVSHTENRVVEGYQAPKKDTSVMSKAIDLLFGW